MLKLFVLLRPYTLGVALVVVLTFLQTLATLYLPTLMSDIVDIGIVQGNLPYIYKIGGLMLLVAALSVVFSVAGGFYASRVSTGFGKLLRSKLFAHVQTFSLQDADKIGTASLIVRTTDDVMHVQQVLIMMLRMMLRAPMMSIGGIIMAISKNAGLSLVFAVVIPVLAVAVTLISSRGMPLFKVLQERLDKLNLVTRERLTGIRVIRAFNRIPHEQDRFMGANTSLMETGIRVNRIMGVMMPVMMVVMNLGVLATLWFGGHLIDAQQMQVGDLMAFIQYAMQIMWSLVMLSMLFVMVPRASVSAARINEVLETQVDVVDPADPKAPGTQKGTLEFERVNFSYPGAEQPALADISFTVNPGQTTALIGGTGSGKSTLVKLIPRFYDVDAGRILVDGVDVRALSQADLRAKIGYVPQQSVLFTGTVSDNIRYGKDDAGADEVLGAAETAQAAEFVAALPEGYDANIAQGGTNLSGGQRQRLAIARALVRRPEIYLFDDCFSALDFRTDAKLRAALGEQTGHAAVIIVAQRVSTVMHADQVIVLNEGRIAGIGTHRQLLQTCGIYKEIVSSQLSEEVSA